MGCLRLSSRHRQPSMLGPGFWRIHARVQLAVNVDDIDAAGAFSAVPAKRRPGTPTSPSTTRRKLVLIENPGSGGSLNHLGVEVTSTAEVIAATRRLAAAGLPTQVEEGTTCCYAPQDKVWATGPGGERWEVYTVLADGGGELEGTSPTSVPSPPPRPAAPLPPAHRPHGRSAAQAERASATDAAGGAPRLRPAVFG